MADSSPRVPSSPSPPADVKSVAPSRLRAGAGDDPDARPARIQMVVALVLGLALVAVPLYLWRRPLGAHAEGDSSGPAASVSATGSAAPGDLGAILPGNGPSNISGANALVGPTSAAITLSESRVLECHDPGPNKTPAEQCDHLAAIEQAFAKAVTDAAGCVPASAGGGSMVFIADVSFGRKKNPIFVTLPRDGRNLGAANGGVRNARASRDASSAKVVAACTAAVKHALLASVGEPLASAPHAHTRYKIAITASYPTPLPAAAPASPYP